MTEIKQSNNDHQVGVTPRKSSADLHYVDREAKFVIKHEIDDEEDDQDELNDESPNSVSNKRSISGSIKRDGLSQSAGSSCHQCKSAKDPSLLLFCSSTAEKGVRKRRCRKKYCESCLKRSYEPSVFEGHLNRPNDQCHWACPSCLGVCVCAACHRSTSDATREGLVEGINTLVQLDPQILSYLGVQPSRLADLQTILASPITNPMGPIDTQTQASLSTLINTMQTHQNQTMIQSLQQSIQSQPGMYGYLQSMPYQTLDPAVMTDQAATNQTVFADPQQVMMMNPAMAFSGNRPISQSNEWMSAESSPPAPRVMRAEIDLTGTPLQQSMSHSVNVSPLQQSINHSNSEAMHISPLQHVRNQSYHSVSGSANGSPSSIATTNSMHSRPVSPAGLPRSMVQSNDQNYSLISSNPTSDMNASRSHAYSNYSQSNQSTNQYSQAAFTGQSQWSSMDVEYEARRRASIVHVNNQSFNQQSMNADEMNAMAVRPLHEFDTSFSQSNNQSNSQSVQSNYPVETRKRAHSACMAVSEVSNQPVSARQRVSPPVGIPRSINPSIHQPRKRSADHAYQHGHHSGHSRQPSHEQLEWEMTNQMQHHSLNQPINQSINQSMASSNFAYSPSLIPASNQSIVPSINSYDMSSSQIHQRRSSRSQAFDGDHQSMNQSINQSMSMMDQTQSNMFDQQNHQNQQINQAHYQSYNQSINQSVHQADVMCPVIQAEELIERCRELHQVQQARQAQQVFSQF